MKKLLIVKTGSTYDSIKKNHGDFEDMIIAASGITKEKFDVFDARDESLTFPLPDKYAGIIITGSHDMLTYNDDWMQDLKDWINTITDTDTPTLGICFGHQAMAEAFGGVVDYRDWGPEVGYVKVKFDAEAYNDELFSLLYDKCSVYQYHSQSVIELPRGATLLATNSIDPVQAIRYNSHMWSCQFHPEFNHEIVAHYINQNALHLTTEGLDPYELLMRLEPDQTGEKLLKQFIKICGL
ncbi:glutamine amidotransferase [Salinivirga cyanobacteriivorans]